MKSREELIKQQEHLLKVYEKVKDQLKAYPNVVKILIGVKEKDGKLTDEGCIKIIVEKKISKKDLDPQDIIPKEIEGVKTDVIVKSERELLAVCSEDQNSYRPIKGGIMINNGRNGSGVGGSGTLGCMAQLNSDNSWVILSNHHVLYGDSGQDNDEIGQPWVGCSWCCKTNVIAKNLNKNLALDCAIAKIEDDISISNVIDDIGSISGAGAVAAINGERVRKRGARTGYTSGTISAIDPGTKEITITPNAAGGPNNDPGGCTNYVSGVTIFAFSGDSGSVVLNDNNEVVALLYAIDTATNTLGFANDILQIQTTLSITIKTTSTTPGRTPIFQTASELETETVLGGNEWIGHLQQRLDETQTGRRIKKKFFEHEKEIFNLVNKCRPVTVVWQRKQGPAFIAALGRSFKYPEYSIPSEINRVSPQNLLMSMAAIMEEHGSDSLRKDIAKYSVPIIQVLKEYNTVEAMFQHISEIDKVPQEQIYQNQLE